MKKFLSLALALMLCLSLTPAFAEIAHVAEDGILTFPMERIHLPDGFSFVAPIPFTYAELSDVEAAMGYIMIGEEPETGIGMMVMLGTVENDVEPAMLALAMQQDTASFSSAILMENHFGQEAILYEAADQSFGGFCVLDGEGYMYTFMFVHTDGSPITGDDVLAKLASESFLNVYFEDKAKEELENMGK